MAKHEELKKEMERLALAIQAADEEYNQKSKKQKDKIRGLQKK
jgi:hypothetical protein